MYCIIAEADNIILVNYYYKSIAVVCYILSDDVYRMGPVTFVYLFLFWKNLLDIHGTLDFQLKML